MRVGTNYLDSIIALAAFWNKGLPEDRDAKEELARKRVSEALELTKDFGKANAEIDVKGAISLMREALNAVRKETVLQLMNDLGATDEQKRLFNEDFLHLMELDSTLQRFRQMHEVAPHLVSLQCGFITLPEDELAELEQLVSSPSS